MAVYFVDSNTSSPWVALADLTGLLGARRVCTAAYGTTSVRAVVFELTTEGTTGAAEPTWNATIGGTTTDGTAVWTARSPTTTANASAFLYYIHNHLATNGDTIYLRSTHSETTAAATVFIAVGTVTSFIKWIVPGTWVDAPTTVGSGGALISTTGDSLVGLNGFLSMNGVSFSVGSGATTTNLTFFSLGTSGAIKMVNGNLKLNTTSASSRIYIGGSAGGHDDQVVVWDNVGVQVSQTTQRVGLRGKLIWTNTPIALVSGTVPAAIMEGAVGNMGTAELSALNFSNLTTGGVVLMTALANLTVSARNITLGGSSTLTSGAIVGHGGAMVIGDNVGTSGAGAEEYAQTYSGVASQELTLVKTGGSTVSKKLVSTAGCQHTFPLYTEWLLYNVTSAQVGVSTSFTLDILHDSVTALKDSDMAIEIEYRNVAAAAASVIATSAYAHTLVAAGSALATSTATWTTTGLSNPNKQSLIVSITPAVAGTILIRAALFKASYTVYVDLSPVVA